MQRYFAKEYNGKLILHDSDIHHIKNVMRMKNNDTIEVVYNNKLYICSINEIEPLSLDIKEVIEEENKINLDITIAIGLVKEQKMDLILQKLTELGVNRIIPVSMERSIVKLDKNKFEKKKVRWETICKEASEQSHRVTIPKIEKIMTMKELLNNKKQLNLICSLNDMTKPLQEYLINGLQDILFVVGPEGGFSPNEEAFLIDNGFEPTTLGKRVLRVETAAIYVASIINYVYKG